MSTVSTSIFNGQGITPKSLNWVLFCVVLGDSERLEFLREKQIVKSCRVGGEAVADFGSLLGVVDLVDPMAGIVAVVGIASGVAVRMASASAVATTTSSSAATVGGLPPLLLLLPPPRRYGHRARVLPQRL
jgi:hypothetical protein